MKDGNEATAQVVHALADAGIDYMLVGSFSSNFYGVPRATGDADFVVVLENRSLDTLVNSLEPKFKLQPQLLFETVTGTMRTILDVSDLPFKVEFFQLSDDPHDQERFSRRVSVRDDALSCNVHIPTPEDVIITKLRWAIHAGRGKDRDDVRDVVAVQGDALDWDYIEAWCDTHGTRDLLKEIRDSIPPL